MTSPSDTRTSTEQTPNRATVTRPAQSSKRVAHKTPLGWLPWALLGLLALLVALALLLVNAVDDDGPDGAAGDTLGQASSGGSGADGADGDGQAAGTETGASGSSAALAAGGTSLLAAPGGRIGELAGQPAEGTALVESVVADEGFWVGESASQRVFVFLTPEARQSAGESGYQVEAGQTVAIAGTVQRSDAGFADRVGVTAAEGRQQLLDQGGYVEATQVRLAS